MCLLPACHTILVRPQSPKKHTAESFIWQHNISTQQRVLFDSWHTNSVARQFNCLPERMRAGRMSADRVSANDTSMFV